LPWAQTPAAQHHHLQPQHSQVRPRSLLRLSSPPKSAASSTPAQQPALPPKLAANRRQPPPPPPLPVPWLLMMAVNYLQPQLQVPQSWVRA
jgi:hypothetical protein